MTVELKSTMRSNNLINEAEMFCTDLEFRMDSNGKTREFIGDLAKKQDDVVRNIQQTISNLMLHFKKKVNELARRLNPSAPNDTMRSLALCIYIATYFRLSVNGHTNHDSEELVLKATESEREHLTHLWTIKEKDLAAEICNYEETYEVFDSFSSYKNVCERCDEPNSGKLNLLVSFKQLFSVPWLLCSE